MRSAEEGAGLLPTADLVAVDRAGYWRTVPRPAAGALPGADSRRPGPSGAGRHSGPGPSGADRGTGRPPDRAPVVDTLGREPSSAL